MLPNGIDRDIRHAWVAGNRTFVQPARRAGDRAADQRMPFAERIPKPGIITPSVNSETPRPYREGYFLACQQECEKDNQKLLKKCSLASAKHCSNDRHQNEKGRY